MKNEGELKIQHVTDRAAAVLPNTSTRGQDIIKTELKSVSDDFDTWSATVNDTSSQIGELYCCWQISLV